MPPKSQFNVERRGTPPMSAPVGFFAIPGATARHLRGTAKRRESPQYRESYLKSVIPATWPRCPQ